MEKLTEFPYAVQTEIYKLYGKAYGWYSLLSLCFFWASEQSTNILTSWWLSQWTTAQILYQIRRALGMWAELLHIMLCMCIAQVPYYIRRALGMCGLCNYTS